MLLPTGHKVVLQKTDIADQLRNDLCNHTCKNMARNQAAVWKPPQGRCTLKSGSFCTVIFLPLTLLGAGAAATGLLDATGFTGDFVAVTAKVGSEASTVR